MVTPRVQMDCDGAACVCFRPESKKIIIFAMRALRAGEEVLYDYKFPFEEEEIECNCGSPNCAGRMN